MASAVEEPGPVLGRTPPCPACVASRASPAAGSVAAQRGQVGRAARRARAGLPVGRRGRGGRLVAAATPVGRLPASQVPRRPATRPSAGRSAALRRPASSSAGSASGGTSPPCAAASAASREQSCAARRSPPGTPPSLSSRAQPGARPRPATAGAASPAGAGAIGDPAGRPATGAGPAVRQRDRGGRSSSAGRRPPDRQRQAVDRGPRRPRPPGGADQGGGQQLGRQLGGRGPRRRRAPAERPARSARRPRRRAAAGRPADHSAATVGRAGRRRRPAATTAPMTRRERQRLAGRVDQPAGRRRAHAGQQHRHVVPPRLGGQRRRPSPASAARTGSAPAGAVSGRRRAVPVRRPAPAAARRPDRSTGRRRARCRAPRRTGSGWPGAANDSSSANRPLSGAAQPGAPGDQRAVVRVDLAEHLPAVAHPRPGQHVLGRDREADPGPHGRGERRRQLGEPLVAGDQQPQQAELAEQPVGPVRPDADDRRRAGGPSVGRRRRLRVDQPGGHRLERAVAGALGAGQPLLHLVVEPAAQLGHAAGDPLGALLGPASARRPGRAAGSPWAPAALAARAARHSRHVGRRLRPADTGLGPEQQQAEGVLAGELAARAGAPVRRAGQVDAHLVRVLPAAPAEPPQDLVEQPGRRPVAGGADRARTLRRARVRGQGGDLCGGPSFNGHRATIGNGYDSSGGLGRRPGHAGERHEAPGS